jgi:protein SCO1/2
VILYVIAVAVFFVAHPSMLAAHSTEQVLKELQQQVPYLQLTDHAAPGFVLEDVDGHKVTLDELKGNVLVLNFTYTRCTDACPLHMTLIGQVQDQVNGTLMRDHVRFVTIATDTEPAAETATIMRTYGKAHGLDSANWTILHGGSAKPGTGIDVAKAYGLEFTPTPNGQQMHGVVTHVIDANGVLRARFHGLKFPALTVTSFINTLLYPDHHAAGAEGVPGTGGPAPAKRGSHLPDIGIPFWLWVVAAAVMLGGGVLAVRRMARAGRMRGNDFGKFTDAESSSKEK